MAICKIHGLDEEICRGLHEGGTPVRITKESRRYGKFVTVVSGIPAAQINEVASELKTRCAAGGTVKAGKIEIQGEHEKKIKFILQEKGFTVS